VSYADLRNSPMQRGQPLRPCERNGGAGVYRWKACARPACRRGEAFRPPPRYAGVNRLDPRSWSVTL